MPYNLAMLSVDRPRVAQAVVFLLLLLPTLAQTGCTAPYFANLARDFGGTLTGPSSDLSPMVRGVALVCRRHGDLAYLRARIEDPTDRHLVAFQDRMTSPFLAKKGIAARCAALDVQVAAYLQMQQVLLAYGSALRSLAETEGVDYRDSFAQMGLSLNKVAAVATPQDPELGLISIEGSDAIGKLLRVGLSARSEADIQTAIRAAALPVRHLLDRMDKVKDAYADEVNEYVNASRSLMAEVERATLPIPKGASGRSFDVISYYHMALHNEDEMAKLLASVQVYRAIMKNLRDSHSRMVEAANSKVPAKEAFRSVRLWAWDLSVQLQYIYDDVNSLRQRGNP